MTRLPTTIMEVTALLILLMEQMETAGIPGKPQRRLTGSLFQSVLRFGFNLQQAGFRPTKRTGWSLQFII